MANFVNIKIINVVRKTEVKNRRTVPELGRHGSLHLILSLIYTLSGRTGATVMII